MAQPHLVISIKTKTVIFLSFKAKKAHKCGVCGFETLYKTALARHITTSSCQTPPQQTLQTPPAPQTQQMPQTPQPQQQRPQTPIIPTQQPQPIQQLQPLQFDHMQPHMLVLKVIFNVS